MTYTAYFGIKYHEDHRNRDLIEAISAVFEKAGIATMCIARDIEKWGKVQFTPHELMKITFDQIDNSDFVILEMSEKGVGLGIEAGYAKAKGKPLLVLAKVGNVLSTTMQGIADSVMYYNRPEDIGKSMLKSYCKSSSKEKNDAKNKSHLI